MMTFMAGKRTKRVLGKHADGARYLASDA